MRHYLCSKIGPIFTSNPYTIDFLSDQILFAYDCKTSNRTYFTAASTNQDKSIKINNPLGKEIIHICIDGGLIRHGLKDYVGDGKPRGRCDCMIFNDDKLLLIEFKMDVQELTRDKTLWKTFSHAMKQIKEFFKHLESSLNQNGDDIFTLYSKENIIPIICMKNQPTFHPRRNAQRNNEKERFRIDTSLKIELLCEYELT